MTEPIDLDVRLSRFLTEEAPRAVPDRLVAATREAVANTRQRRRGFGSQVSQFLLTPIGSVAAIVAVVVLGSILTLSNPFGSGVGTAPSPVASFASAAPTLTAPPSASPSPSPSPSACPTDTDPCVGDLQPGVHSSTRFVPTVHFSVLAGWTNTADLHGQFDLRYAAGGSYTYPDGITFYDAISIFRRPVAESAISHGPLEGVGTTARDLSRWLAGHADLVASKAVPTTIGGARGYELTLSLPNGPRSSPDHCTTDHGELRCESLFVSSDPAATYEFGLVGPEIAVVYLLDLSPGDTVMVVIDNPDGIDQAGLEAAGRPVVESLSFSP